MPIDVDGMPPCQSAVTSATTARVVLLTSRIGGLCVRRNCGGAGADTPVTSDSNAVDRTVPAPTGSLHRNCILSAHSEDYRYRRTAGRQSCNLVKKLCEFLAPIRCRIMRMVSSWCLPVECSGNGAILRELDMSKRSHSRNDSLPGG